MEYLETECSIDSLVSCSGCNEQMIPDISFQPQCGTMEAKPDEDGEQRILELELPVNITMKFYEDVGAFHFVRCLLHRLRADTFASAGPL